MGVDFLGFNCYNDGRFVLWKQHGEFAGMDDSLGKAG